MEINIHFGETNIIFLYVKMAAILERNIDESIMQNLSQLALSTMPELHNLYSHPKNY